LVLSFLKHNYFYATVEKQAIKHVTFPTKPAKPAKPAKTGLGAAGIPYTEALQITAHYSRLRRQSGANQP
jgi:hypothetical protein